MMYSATDAGTGSETMQAIRTRVHSIDGDLLPRMETPVQLFAGSNDAVVPPVNTKFLRALLPKSQLDIFDSGRFHWEDRADEFAMLVTEWWSGGYQDVMTH